jgi:hypothetical protein
LESRRRPVFLQGFFSLRRDGDGHHFFLGSSMPHISVSEAARKIGHQVGRDVRPKDISELFYRRQLRDDLCPVVSGRRLIPLDYLPLIVAALRRAGKLPFIAETEVSNVGM